MRDTQAQESRYRSAGIPGAAPLVPVGDRPKTAAGRVWRAFLGWLKTASVTLGVMYVIAWVTITLAIPGMNMRFARMPSMDNTLQRGVIAEVARPFVLPTDPRITADEAGRAFVAILPAERRSPDFPRPAVEDHSDAPWRGEGMAPDLFKDMRASAWNGPSSAVILEAAARGLPARDMALLRTYATAPIWNDFDLVTRAPAVDLVGSRFLLPFRENARVYSFPLLRFAATKEMAYAGVSRAAYHLAHGRRADAERVLRGVISYGFVLKDNGASTIDDLIGDVIVGIGRDALARYYDIVHDPRGAELALAHKRAAAGEVPVPGPAWEFTSGDNAAARARLIQLSQSPQIPRGVRFEALHALGQTACGRPKDFVFGPGSDIKGAFAEARRSLARYPAELALIDLIERTVPAGLPDFVGPGAPSVEQRVLDAVRISEKVFFNPRLSGCLVRGLGGGF